MKLNRTPEQHAGDERLTDGALDTLGSLIQVLGEESFPIEGESDAMTFRAHCQQMAVHVENGAAVPASNIAQSASGERDWGKVRRFLSDRRRAEKLFVTERLHSYRDVVEDLLVGLRQVGERDQTTEARIIDNLALLDSAITTGKLPDIRSVLADTIQNVTATFVEQKAAYEAQLQELNSRMSNLRQDLVDAREEMQRDALTDAFNRGAFDKAIETSFNLYSVLGQPVTLIMIDLDHFKDINDNHGHATGDKVLQAVSQALERTFIRKSDFVARYGGDEFAVILNDTTAANSVTLVERFLRLANSIEIDDTTLSAPVSCSAGFAEMRSGDNIAALIKRADSALYQAKAAGRNTSSRL
jgi:diguanylate cyclase